jgi:hypothetical protein
LSISIGVAGATITAVTRTSDSKALLNITMILTLKQTARQSVAFQQPQSLPQLHSFLLFIGQFLPVFLQLCFSAAKELVQIIAARIDIRIVVIFFIRTNFPMF